MDPKPPVIVPQSITVRTPQGEAPPPRRSRVTGWIVLIVVVGAVLLGGYVLVDAVFRWVPKVLGVKEPQSASAPAEPSAPVPEKPVPAPTPRTTPAVQPAPPTEAPDPARLQAERTRAEELLGELLGAQRELAEAGVVEWGDEDYAELLRLSKAGDESMIRPDYPAAARSYEEALEACRRLIEALPAALPRMLREGEAALKAADGPLARRKFGAAVQLDGENDAARKGLQRAGTIEAVTERLRAAAAKEAEGRLPLALADYQEAAGMDPLSDEAVAGVARVSAGIRQGAFQDLMTRGLAALRAGDLDEADALIKKARDLDAASPAVREAMTQVEEARRVARIRQMEPSARDAERREGWDTALGLYESVLAIDPLVRWAQEGRDRMQTRVRLQNEMSAFLATPTLLETEEGRTRAAETLQAARPLREGAPAWSRQVEAVEVLVKRATTPIEVTLRSDGQTGVDVYRVGRFPPFQTKSLSLLPGRYTIVGHRPGFRDVRLDVQVAPGLEPIQADIVCRDPIR